MLQPLLTNSALVGLVAGLVGLMVPEPARANSDPRFALCSATSRLDGRRLILDFECRQQTGRFDPKDYEDFRQAMAQALSQVQPEIVFKAGTN